MAYLIRCDCCPKESGLIMAEYIEKVGQDPYIFIRHKNKGRLHTVKIPLLAAKSKVSQPDVKGTSSQTGGAT